MPRREVELLNTDPSCVDAVRKTLAMAPISATLIEEDGRFYVDGSDFALWAIEQQGYVKRVLPDPKATP